MSRSKRKVPIRGIAPAPTENGDKRIANRKHRHLTKIQVNKGENMSEIREVSNVWPFAKDGKRFLKNPTEKDIRK